MIYLPKKKRKKCDKLVDLMIKHNINPYEGLDDLLFKFCKKHIRPDYNNYKNFRAEILECKEAVKKELSDVGEMNFIIHNWQTMSKEDEATIMKMMIKVIRVDGDLHYVLFKLCKFFKEAEYSILFYYRQQLQNTWRRVGKELMEPHENKKIKRYGG